MSAERDELHDLIDALPDDEIVWVLAEVRRRIPRELGCMAARLLRHGCR